MTTKPSSHLLIITGASSGIGASMAQAAANDGAIVATMSRRPGPGEHLATDLADPAAWPAAGRWIADQIADAVDRGSERVSFVHNAGVLDPIGFAGEIDPESYQRNVLLNAASGQVLGSAFLAAMSEVQIPGALVMVSSGAGKNPFLGWSSYCAAKAAVDMWVRVAGLEQAERDSGVVVLSVGPGVVDTAMQEKIRSSETDAFPDVERFRQMHGAARLASPDDVGAKYWALCQRDDLEQGAVVDISSFDA